MNCNLGNLIHQRSFKVRMNFQWLEKAIVTCDAGKHCVLVWLILVMYTQWLMSLLSFRLSSKYWIHLLFPTKEILLTFYEPLCITFPRKQFSNMQHKILKDIRRLWNIHHKIFEYAMQDIESTSENYGIYITRFRICNARYYRIYITG